MRRWRKSPCCLSESSSVVKKLNGSGRIGVISPYRNYRVQPHRPTLIRGFLKACATLFVVLLAVATAAAAQEASGQAASDPQQLTDLSLEDLLKLKVNTVYAASKFEQEIVQAPAAVSIITAEEIQNHGYRTLADVLRSVRGFYVSYDRNYSYVGVRGFQRPGDYNGRILLLVNGHQLNDTIFESALLGTESPIDLSVIDRVEVVRGPS